MHMYDVRWVVQGTASEATFVALLAARSRAVTAAKTADESSDIHVLSKLVAYCSDQVTVIITEINIPLILYIRRGLSLRLLATTNSTVSYRTGQARFLCRITNSVELTTCPAKTQRFPTDF